MEIVEDLDPTSYSQAINGHDAENWMNVMREEIESIHKNQVWQLVVYPKVERPSVVNGFLRRNLTRMVPWINTSTIGGQGFHASGMN